MGPICTLRFLVFEVPSWGPKLDPIFMALGSQNGFKIDLKCSENVALQLPILVNRWNQNQAKSYLRKPKKGGTAVSGRMAFRIRSPTFLLAGGGQTVCWTLPLNLMSSDILS